MNRKQRRGRPAFTHAIHVIHRAPVALSALVRLGRRDSIRTWTEGSKASDRPGCRKSPPHGRESERAVRERAGEGAPRKRRADRGRRSRRWRRSAILEIGLDASGRDGALREQDRRHVERRVRQWLRPSAARSRSGSSRGCNASRSGAEASGHDRKRKPASFAMAVEQTGAWRAPPAAWSCGTRRLNARPGDQSRSPGAVRGTGRSGPPKPVRRRPSRATRDKVRRQGGSAAMPVPQARGSGTPRRCQAGPTSVNQAAQRWRRASSSHRRSITPPPASARSRPPGSSRPGCERSRRARAAWHDGSRSRPRCGNRRTADRQCG
jgi:hypothetical protein